MIDKVSDILLSRGVSKIFYFHTDHFEPWSLGINDQTLKALERFSNQTKKSKFTQNLSLFYLINLPAKIRRDDHDLGWFVDDDNAGFAERDPKWINRAKDLIRPLERELNHEIHLHIHHERWTQNSETYDPNVHAWVNKYSNAEKDSSRLDLGLRVARSFMEEELGRPFDSWAFVHGNWALNASDHTICRIENEIEILAKHGCWGDFTFPAGRGHCDPTILEEPYVCKPIKGIKSYDTNASQPKKLSEFSNGFENNFFIWNSVIKANYSSLDYYSEANCRLFKQPEIMIEKWLSESYESNGCLYLKTHSHSMKWEYEMHQDGHPIPHLFPDVSNVFEMLERVCEQAGVQIECVSVNAVRNNLLPNFMPPKSLVETIPILQISDGIALNYEQVFDAVSKIIKAPQDILELNLEALKIAFNTSRHTVYSPIVVYSERYLVSAVVFAVCGYKIDFYGDEANKDFYQAILIEIKKIYPIACKNFVNKCGDLLDIFVVVYSSKPLLLADKCLNIEPTKAVLKKLLNFNILISNEIGFIELIGQCEFRNFAKITKFTRLSYISFENFSFTRGPISTVLNFMNDFHHEIGNCYQIDLRKYVELGSLHDSADGNENPRRSTIKVYFNGQLLEGAHSPHALIRSEGGGRYSHWGSVLYFSTPDNSNPLNKEDLCWVSIEVGNENLSIV
jgi:hypothetical protein